MSHLTIRRVLPGDGLYAFMAITVIFTIVSLLKPICTFVNISVFCAVLGAVCPVHVLSGPLPCVPLLHRQNHLRVAHRAAVSGVRAVLRGLADAEPPDRGRNEVCCTRSCNKAYLTIYFFSPADEAARHERDVEESVSSVMVENRRAEQEMHDRRERMEKYRDTHSGRPTGKPRHSGATMGSTGTVGDPHPDDVSLIAMDETPRQGALSARSNRATNGDPAEIINCVRSTVAMMGDDVRSVYSGRSVAATAGDEQPNDYALLQSQVYMPIHAKPASEKRGSDKRTSRSAVLPSGSGPA